ncbi:MAG: hypothetical protein GWP03_03250 [Proteobacteria bacterium]|nr:hypothetical protein [Pseudomonadota bacterium]
MKRYFNFVLLFLVVLSFTTLSAHKLDIDNSNKQKNVMVQITDTTSDDAVSVGGDLVVNGVVNGDAVSVGGVADINGKITGDLVLIGSSGKIGPKTEVEGSFVNIGSSLDIDRNAVFHGEKTFINLGPINRLIGNRYLRSYRTTNYHRNPFSVITFHESSWIGMIARFIICYLLALALVVLFKRGTNNVERTMNISPFATFLAGFLVELLIIPSIIVLAVSIIGIPLIPILILALFVALIFGGAVLTYMIGKYTVNKIEKKNVHISLTVLTGLIITSVIPLLGFLLNLTNVTWLNILFVSLNFTEAYILITYALGSVTLSRFGTRIYKEEIKTNEE